MELTLSERWVEWTSLSSLADLVAAMCLAARASRARLTRVPRLVRWTWLVCPSDGPVSKAVTNGSSAVSDEQDGAAPGPIPIMAPTDVAERPRRSAEEVLPMWLQGSRPASVGGPVYLGFEPRPGFVARCDARGDSLNSQ